MALLKQKQLHLAAVEAELKVIQMELEDKNRQLKVCRTVDAKELYRRGS